LNLAKILYWNAFSTVRE